MSASIKHARLVEKIIRATNNGSVKWEAGSSNETFRLKLPSGSIEIWEAPIYGGDPDSEDVDVMLQIKDNNETIVDEFADTDLARSGYHPFGEENGWYKRLRSFYEETRRIALGVEDVLDDLIRDVDDLG